jgi:hypothetical protein
MITVKHLKADTPRDERLRLRDSAEEGRVDVALEFLQRGDFDDVAVVDTDDLHEAHRLTQNGGASFSWSRRPPDGVSPTAPGFVEISGKQYGYKDTEIGDVLVKADDAYVVGRGFAFHRIEGWSPSRPSFGA